MNLSPQERKMLSLLRQNKIIFNYEFAQHRILSYTKIISNLRKKGYNIIKFHPVIGEKKTGIYGYILKEEEEAKNEV